MPSQDESSCLSKEEFVLRAIRELPAKNKHMPGGKNYGINVWVSGLQLAFRHYFDDDSLDNTLFEMEHEGTIVIVRHTHTRELRRSTIYLSDKLPPSFLKGGKSMQTAAMALRTILKTAC